MEGQLDTLVKDKGSGVVVIERVTGREPLGSWPGARVKAQFWMHIPRPGGELKAALLMVGVEAASPRPVRIRLMLDGAGITRELKPQFTARLDETFYLKAVYDVKPILKKRLGRGDLHRLQVYYDLVQPVFFRDATMLVIAETDKAKYAVSALTGVKVLEPGEVTVEYPPFYHSFGGRRRASLVIHSPYHEAGFEVVVAGYRAGPLQGSGSFPVEVDFRYDGSLVPVSVRYLDPGYQYYPRRAVVTDIVLEEVLLPEIRINLEVEEARVEEGTVRVRAKLRNESEVPLTRPVIALIGLGGQLAGKRLRELPPEGEAEVTLRADLRRLPLQPQSLIISLSGYALGKRVEKSVEVRLA